MAWQIEYAPQALKELKKLDRQIAQRIAAFLGERVATLDNPRTLGEALTGPSLGQYWKYRVGKYRVIADIRDATVTVYVVK